MTRGLRAEDYRNEEPACRAGGPKPSEPGGADEPSSAVTPSLVNTCTYTRSPSGPHKEHKTKTKERSHTRQTPPAITKSCLRAVQPGQGRRTPQLGKDFLREVSLSHRWGAPHSQLNNSSSSPADSQTSASLGCYQFYGRARPETRVLHTPRASHCSPRTDNTFARRPNRECGEPRRCDGLTSGRNPLPRSGVRRPLTRLSQLHRNTSSHKDSHLHFIRRGRGREPGGNCCYDAAETNAAPPGSLGLDHRHGRKVPRFDRSSALSPLVSVLPTLGTLPEPTGLATSTTPSKVQV